MDIASIPLFSMLRSRIGYLNQRQELIAQNVANASTPGFTPRDMKPFTVRQGPGASLALAPASQGESAGGQSSAGMIALPSSGGGQTGVGSIAAPDDESRLDGNQVVLEEQMMKMSETRTQYEAAVGIYVKAMNLLQMAAKQPGK
jgi:flagellar basal-body rod protein FlgB